MANALKIELTVDDKGSVTMKQFGGNAEKALGKVKTHAKAGAAQAGKMERAWKKSASHIQAHWKGYAVVGGAAVAAVGYAIKRFADASSEEFKKYNTAVTDMGKITDETAESIKSKIGSIGPKYGDATELTKAYYNVISAGVTEPVAAMDTLKESVKAAKAAHIESAETVTGITALMEAYGDKIKGASESADLLFQIEASGKTTVKELIPYIGELAGKSAALGISQDELGASFAQVTLLSGSTSNAATQYKAILTSLMAPSEAMTKLLGKYGGAQKAIADMGFEGVLKLIAEESGGNAAALQKLMGSAEAVGGTLTLLGNDMAGYSQRLADMKDKTGLAEKAFNDWEKSMEGVEETYNNTIKNVLISVGEKLAPIMKDYMQLVTDMIKKNPQLIDQIGEFVKNILDLALAMGKVIALGVEFTNVWVKTWQAMGLASAGVITWKEALTEGTAAIEQFEKAGTGLKVLKDIAALEKKLAYAIRFRTRAEKKGNEVLVKIYNEKIKRYQKELGALKKKAGVEIRAITKISVAEQAKNKKLLAYMDGLLKAEIKKEKKVTKVHTKEVKQYLTTEQIKNKNLLAYMDDLLKEHKATSKEKIKITKDEARAVADYAKESTKIYDRMYDDIQKLDLGDYKYSEKLLDKRYKNYEEHLTSLAKQDSKYADGVKLLDKWLAAEKEKIWDKQAREHGGIIDTMKVAWKDFSKESLNTSKTMYDAWKESMGLMKTALSDTFYAALTGKIRDIGSIWDTFTKNLKATFMRMISDMAAQKIILFFKNAWAGNPAGTGVIEKMLGIDVPFLTFAGGGEIPGAYNGKKGFAGDTVPIMATPGEYMVRREAAQDPAIRSLLDSLNQGGLGAGLIAKGKNIPAMMGYADGGIIAPELSHYGFGSFFSSAWSGIKSVVKSVVSAVGEVIGVVTDIPIVGDVLKTVFKYVGELTKFLSEDDLGRALAAIGNVALAIGTGGASIPAQLAGFGIGGGISLAMGSDWEQAAWNASVSSMFAGGAKVAAAAAKGTETVQLSSGRWVDVPKGSITELGAGSYYQAPTGEFLPIAALPENNLATYWSIASQAPKATIANIKAQSVNAWAKVGNFMDAPWEELKKTGADLGDLTKEKWEALRSIPSDAWKGLKNIPTAAWAFMRDFKLLPYLAGNLPSILGNMQLSIASASGGESLGRMGSTLGIGNEHRLGGGGFGFARRGGLFSSPTIMAEHGPEWAVPTYEPERSRFLKDVGADPDKLAAAIVKKVGGRSGGNTFHFDSLFKNEGTLIADEDTFNEFVEKIDERLYKLQQWGH